MFVCTYIYMYICIYVCMYYTLYVYVRRHIEYRAECAVWARLSRFRAAFGRARRGHRGDGCSLKPEN